MSDAALARRVLDADPAAFEEFFAAYFPRLYRFVLPRVAGNEDTAEEIVQRVLIRAIDRLRTYKGEASLLTWLCTFCRREISAWRHETGVSREVSFFDDKREVHAALEILADENADDPEKACHRREVSGLVQLTLDHLPNRYGDVLEWKYIHGLSVEEIAERLGVGYKAAESLLTRARASFREGFSFIASDWSDPPGARWPRPSEGS
jgi:RNA polymerase sigma-70 factor (ECF subfamily)